MNFRETLKSIGIIPVIQINDAEKAVPLALAQCTRARTAGRVLTALSALASLGYLAAFALRWQVW